MRHDRDPHLEVSVQDLYGETGFYHPSIDDAVDEVPSPRGKDTLFDVAARLGLAPGRRVLDVGCRDGRHLLELTRRFGCHSFGVEPVVANVDRGRDALAKSRQTEPHVAALVHMALGRIEALPFRDRTFDVVWARDMLIHVEDLTGGLKECRRVLMEGGRALVFQMFATPWLEPNEARRLWPPLAAVPRNVDPDYFETCVERAAFTVVARDEIRSEWREFAEESGEGTTSRQLLRAAKLVRARDRLRPRLGALAYEATLADCLWGVYQMIGKLSGRIYVLA